MRRFLLTAGLAALLTCAAAAAQNRLPTGDYNNGPITSDQAWENGTTYWSEYRHVHSVQYFDTIPYNPRTDPGADGLRFPEFRTILATEFRLADRNGNGRIDNETERCLFHRTPEGIAAGGIGFSAANIDEATRRRQAYIASRRVWTGPNDWTGNGEWPISQEFAALAGQDGQLHWPEIPGCAFMAQTAAAPTSPAAPTTPVRPPAVPPVTPSGPVAVTPVQSTPQPCTRAPTQQEAVRQVFTAWGDGRLTAQEADGLNRGRHCQLDQNRDGRVTEAEFVAVSLADFDRADRNRDGTLSGRQELGAFAGAPGTTAAGLTRQQANDIARLRFAVLDRQPRDGGVPLDEYLAVTAQEFTRNDANGDGALTAQEAARQPAAQ